MKNTRRILLGFILVFIIVIGYFFWHGSFVNNGVEQYRIEEVRLGTVMQTVAANGTLNPVVLVNVGAQVTGKVQKIYADFNDRVKKGQVLLELDSALLQAEVDQSLAEFEKAKVNLELTTANLKRGKPLYRDGFIAKQDWDELLREKNSALAELRFAEAKLIKNRTNLDYATIRSPVSGVVINRQVDVGQTVTSSFQTPILFQIAEDLSKMQIDSSFAEADIGNIKPGQEVTFRVDAFFERDFFGVVKQIRLAPTVQQNVVTYNVVVMVKNEDRVLLPGMTAYVNIKTAEHKNVMLVPNAALRFRPKNSKLKKGIVYKLVGDKLEQVSCRIGITDNNYVEVFSKDLKVGDKVVVGYTKEGQTKRSFRIKVF